MGPGPPPSDRRTAQTRVPRQPASVHRGASFNSRLLSPRFCSRRTARRSNHTRCSTIEALIGTATLSVGGLLGFLFGIPRTTRPRSTEVPGADDGRRETTTTPYEPSNNLEQVADWLTKILVGVGLVELGTLGGALASVGDQVAKAVTPTPTGTAVVTEVIIITFATIGFLASFLWTRIYYGGIQARADNDIVNWVASKLEDQETRIDRADKVAQKLASGKLIPGGPPAPVTPVMVAATPSDARSFTPPTGGVAVTAEQAMPSSVETEAPISALPPEIREKVDRFLLTGVKWDDDTIVEIFGQRPSTADGRHAVGRISCDNEKALGDSLIARAPRGTADRRRGVVPPSSNVPRASSRGSCGGRRPCRS